MYLVIIRNDASGNFVVCGGPFETIREAHLARKVSGDLVVHSETYLPVISKEWLWAWELLQHDCYAQRMQRCAEKGLYRVGRVLK